MTKGRLVSLSIIALLSLWAIVITVLWINTRQKGAILIPDNVTTVTTRNPDSSMVSSIQAVEATKKEAEKVAAINDSTVERLRRIIKDYQRTQLASATGFNANTTVNTTSVTRVERGADSSPVYASNFALGRWVYGTSIANKDSTNINLKIRNEYAVTVGREDGKTYADVTSMNPYTEVPTVRSFDIKVPEATKVQFSVYGGYGLTYIDKQIKVGPQVGVGVSYTMFPIKRKK